MPKQIFAHPEASEAIVMRKTSCNTLAGSSLAVAALVALFGCGAAGVAPVNRTSGDPAPDPNAEAAPETPTDEQTCDARIEFEGTAEEADTWVVVNTAYPWPEDGTPVWRTEAGGCSGPSCDRYLLVSGFSAVRGLLFHQAEGHVLPRDADRLRPSFFRGSGSDYEIHAQHENLFLVAARMGPTPTDRARILWVVPIHRVDEGAEVLSELDRGECPRARLPRPADCWRCSMITVHLQAPSCMRILRMSCGLSRSCAIQEVCDPACCTAQTSGGRSDRPTSALEPRAAGT